MYILTFEKRPMLLSKLNYTFLSFLKNPGLLVPRSLLYKIGTLTGLGIILTLNDFQKKIVLGMSSFVLIIPSLYVS